MLSRGRLILPPQKKNKDSEVLLLFEVNEDLYVRQKKL